MADAAIEKKRVTEFQHNKFVLASLVSKDFKLKYRRSFLGIVWSVLNPLLMMIVLAAVFSYMFRFNIENFPLYLILGQIMFDFMNRSTNSAMSSIIDAQSLIKKIRIEKMIFPMEKVMFELLNTAISMIAAVLVMAYFQVLPSVHAIWGLPLLIIFITMFSFGLSLLISALSVFFRDVMHLWSVVLTAWTYATPLFYPFAILPGWMQTLERFNPMYVYVTYVRDVVLYQTVPSVGMHVACVAFAAVSLLLGIVVFKKNQHKFILFI